MGLVGREIVQSRVWIEPVPKPAPSLNYKETFPITVFDAVRESPDDPASITLRQTIDKIYAELRGKQNMIPARPSNYLVTYGGIAGAVGAIQISQSIPQNLEDLSANKIPSEKAVGELLHKVGIVETPGGGTEINRKVRWSDIIGRPNIYTQLGENEDGVVTQKAIYVAISNLRQELISNIDGVTNTINTTKRDLDAHLRDFENPHHVTIDQIGGIGKEIFDSHINDFENPHHVTIEQIGAVSKEDFDHHTEAVNPHNITAEMLGLGNVDNTSDADKPISKATQAALDAINQILESTGDDVSKVDCVTDVEYDRETGILMVVFSNGNSISYNIPIDGLVDDIAYDSETKEIVVTELGGSSHRLNISELFVRYVGSVTPNITVEIIRDGATIGSDEITPADVRDTWATNGEGSTEADEGEITKVFVDYTWQTKGEGSTVADEDEISKETVDYHWATKGEGVIQEGGGASGSTTGETWTVKARINERSITEKEMADDSVISRIIKNQSVTNEKIKDLTITTIKYADGSVTTEKIADLSITNGKLDSRSVSGRTLFTSTTANRVLAVLASDSDPMWTQITSDMIKDGTIQAKNIAKKSLTADLFADGAIGNTSITNHSITLEKLNITNSIKNEHIVNNTIEGDKIVYNVTLPGTPSVDVPPSNDSDDSSISTTQWVNQTIKNYVMNDSNIADRSILGNHLFSSAVRNRVLVTLKASTDPVWGTINADMIDNSAIEEIKIKDGAVTKNKIKEGSIVTSHLTQNIIKTEHITENAVTLDKIEKSNMANRVLAALSAEGHPVYTQVTREMIAPSAVSAEQIEDYTLSPSKFTKPESGQKVLGVGLSNTSPEWMQVTNGMIGNRAVDGRTLFSSPIHDAILGVTVPDTEPAWMKVNGGMIQEGAIGQEHISDAAIQGRHLSEKAIESKHILDWTIKTNNIAPRAVTGVELFTSPVPNRVLAVTTMPYSNPAWLQITTDMIEDCAVSREKIFQSANPYRVLGTSQAGVPPEYIMITSDYIVDRSIIGEKLVRDIAFQGSPSLTVPPPEDSEDYHLANTAWVKHAVSVMLDQYNPELLFDAVNSDRVKQLIKEAIDDHSIDGTKLFTHPYGPRVLGITKANEDVEFILIEEDLIADAAVTTNKLQRDIHLLGSPEVEIRPAPQASDGTGDGHQIPDCQWVLDRIAEGAPSTNPPSTPATLTNGSVITEYIQDRAITGKKLFTSTQADRILGVISSNGDPEWTQATNGMLGNRSVDGRVLFTSDTANKVLAVTDANTDPIFTTIQAGMIADDAVVESNIANKAVTSIKLGEKSVTSTKLADEPMIDEVRLMDNAVTTEKIADNSITAEKIENNAVSGGKIAANVELVGTPTVKHSTTYKQKSLRNITLSSEAPSGGSDGDIWFQFM